MPDQENIPKQNSAHKKDWRPRLIVFLIIASVAVSAGVIFNELQKMDRERRLAEEARRQYLEAQQRQETPEPTSTSIPQATGSTQPSPTPLPEPTPMQIRPEFLELMETYDNNDIVGYLRIDGTSVDYPVLQSGDNSFYLDHDIRKQPASAGWPFLDYENNIMNQDKNTIIYGHNMRADIMFHSLRYYTDEEYYKKHRYITFNTLYEDCTWEIFSFYVTTVDFFYIQAIFESDEEFYNLAKEMKSRSMYDTGVEIRETDRILTLSTCTGYPGQETRFVVNAKLVKAKPEENKKISVE